MMTEEVLKLPSCPYPLDSIFYPSWCQGVHAQRAIALAKIGNMEAKDDA